MSETINETNNFTFSLSFSTVVHTLKMTYCHLYYMKKKLYIWESRKERGYVENPSALESSGTGSWNVTGNEFPGRIDTSNGGEEIQFISQYPPLFH